MSARFCAVLIALIGGANAWGASSTVTATPPPTVALKPLSAQQQKVKRCNVQANAKHLTGIARRTFVKACIK